MCMPNYDDIRTKEIERYQYYSVHGDVIVITSDPSSISALSVHGSVIVVPNVSDLERYIEMRNRELKAKNKEDK